MPRRKKANCMKLEFGSIRQKTKGGSYYYRYQINGRRKEIPLKTHDKVEAERKAKDLIPIAKASSVEIIAAHVNHAKGFAKQLQQLPLEAAWDKYALHPDRAMPHTVSEQLAYRSTFQEFVDFVTQPVKCKKAQHTLVTTLGEVSTTVAEEYSATLKTKSLAVDTHNRKIKRMRKIFSVLQDYYSGENPFFAKSLLRNTREEQNNIIRRQAFTKEQEKDLLQELKNPERVLLNKDEIRIIFIMGMYTGQRMKDCVLMQWQNIDFIHHQIYVHQHKTGKEVTIPIAPALLEALKEAEQWKNNIYVCPNVAKRYNKVDKNGKNTGNNLVNKDVLRVIRWAGLEPSVSVAGRKKKMTVYGFHSLRHSFCSFCAEANVPKAVLLSILGTDSDIADKYYTHVGSEAQQQAIAAIEGIRQSKSPQARINDVVKLLDSKPKITKKLLTEIRSILAD